MNHNQKIEVLRAELKAGICSNENLEKTSRADENSRLNFSAKKIGPMMKLVN
jgi:hypothetical protein